jgi:hypothetical protein
MDKIITMNNLFLGAMLFVTIGAVVSTAITTDTDAKMDVITINYYDMDSYFRADYQDINYFDDLWSGFDLTGYFIVE